MNMNVFKKNKKQLSIFITAGYPKLDSTIEQILFLQDQGVDFIEIGIPFSDPMADGPTIQETSSVALKNGMNLDVLFEQLKNNQHLIKTPLVLMGYLNPVLQYGLTAFLEKCRSNQIASVILPDLNPELYARFYQVEFEKHHISISFLVTPMSENDQIAKIAQLSAKSFVYLVSQVATTGNQHQFELKDQVRFAEIKTICGNTPVFMGFGIKTKDDVLYAQEQVDGAIIGTAFLKSIAEKKSSSYISGLR
jgi:tryptophan synthase alpha chain